MATENYTLCAINLKKCATLFGFAVMFLEMFSNGGSFLKGHIQSENGIDVVIVQKIILIHNAYLSF